MKLLLFALLGLSLVWMWGVRQLARFAERRLPPHPLLARMPEFLQMCLRCNELRLQRMGLLDRPLAELSAASKAALVAEAYARKTAGGLWSRVTALRPGGMLAVWSVAPDPQFTKRLGQSGMKVEELKARAHGGKGARHVIWVATKA